MPQALLRSSSARKGHLSCWTMRLNCSPLRQAYFCQILLTSVWTGAVLATIGGLPVNGSRTHDGCLLRHLRQMSMGTYTVTNELKH